MLETDAYKAFHYSLGNRSKEKNLSIRFLANLLTKDLLNNLVSNPSPDYVTSNLPFLVLLSGWDADACLLEMNMLPGDGRSCTFGHLGVPHIEMVYINRASTSVMYITNY